jgi:hypothetical protein
MSNQTPITLPARADGAELVLKLNDTHNPMDVGFATQVKGDKTKTKPAVDAVLVDHGVVENSKGNAALRCLFIVLKGVDVEGKDLTGRDAAVDLSFSGDGADYTAANLRLMGFDFSDIDAAAKSGDKKVIDAAEAAFLARLNDPAKSGGCMKKIVNLKFEQDEFPKGSGTIYRRLTLGGISQPMAKLDTAATASKLGGIFKTLVASKDGPPKRDNDGKGSGPRNPTSAPPPVQNGGVAPDSDIPF